MSSRAIQPRLLWAVIASVALGIALRLAYPQDIEFKPDEVETVQFIEAMQGWDTFPWIGQNSSNGLRHPGLGIWLFLIPAKLLGVTTPAGVARITQIFSCLALGLFLFFVLRVVRKDEPEESEAWLFGLALIAVNPLMMILERKIWHPSLLPFFVMAMIWAWWKRRSPWVGGFLWGLFGALLGQIHMAGWFFALALLVWTALFDPRRREVKFVHWFIGSALGAVPLLPWVMWVFQNHQSEPLKLSLVRWVMFRYWNFWLSNPLGWISQNSVGHDFGEFLSMPIVSGRFTYLVGAVHLALFALSGLTFFWLARSLWRSRKRWKALFIGKEGETSLILSAGLWGAGILATLAAINITRYFHLAVWPLPFLFLARVWLRHAQGRRVLWAFVALNFIASASLLVYIHQNSMIRGDYWMPYSHQAPYVPKAARKP